jgi:heme exporter protein B
MTPFAVDISIGPGAFAIFLATLKRELTLAMRRSGELLNPLIFFLIAVSLIPLAVGPEAALLAKLAPGVIWVMALLATLLSLDGLFQSDLEDGSLEQLMISAQPLYLNVLAKVIVHWLMTGLPLTLMAPLLGAMLSLPTSGIGPLCWSLLLGTGCMSLVGAIGAGLTVTLRRSGLLLSLIVMPLYIPVLIFGSSAVQSGIDGGPIHTQLAVLGALFAIAVVLAPLATAGALRISADS